jgi:hypothetical protein
VTIPASNPIIVAPANMPFCSNESPDLDALTSNVDKFSSTALSGFVVGSYGVGKFHIEDL